MSAYRNPWPMRIALVLIALGALFIFAKLATAQAADTFARQQSVKDTYQDAPAVAVVSATPFAGLYIGAHLGYGHTVLSDDDGRGGLALSGLSGGLRAGGDIQRDAVVFGGWLEYNWSGSAVEAFGATFVEQTDDWSANARIGTAQGRTLFYVFGGAGQVTFEGGGEERGAPLWRAGAGIEHLVSERFSLSLEYAHSWIDADELLGDGAEDVVDINEDRVMLVGRFRFGAPGLGIFTAD